MKMKRILLTTIILGTMLSGAAMAEDYLTAGIDGDTLKIEWEAQGECVLTVYRNDWPEVIRNVAGEAGGAEIRVQPGGRYSVRLRTAGGCFSAEVAEITEKPTWVPGEETEVSTQNPTINPIQKPTPVPSDTLIPKPTVVPVPTVVVPAVDQLSNGQSMTSMAAAVISMVNEERAKYGLQPLSVNAQLMSAAAVRAQEIAGKFSHTRPDGSAWSTVSSAAKGENIARGQSTAERVMAAWMTSEGHRKNILRESFGSIGVCVLKVNGVIHWVQLFGK